MSDPQKTAQTLSKAFSELLAESQKVFEASSEQTTLAVKEISVAFEQVQKETGKVLENLANYFSARYQSSIEMGATMFNTVSADSPTPSPKGKDLLEKQLELDKDLYRTLTSHMASLQARQISLARDLVTPKVAVLEASQKQLDGVVKFGAAVLEAYEQMAESFYTWPAQVAARPVAQPR